MKRILTVILAVLTLAVASFASAEDALQTIENAKTTQAFTQDAVSDEDLNTILEAGLSAASAMNQQPWYFAVVTNKDVMTEISGPAFDRGAMPQNAALPEGFDPQNMPATGNSNVKAGLGDTPVAIVIYLDESGMGSSSFDCGLACQNMVIAATALGYGTKIVSSPTMTLNGEQHDEICGKLGVDSSLKAVAVLLIGVPDSTVDGYSGATTRKALEEKVSFVR